MTSAASEWHQTRQREMRHKYPAIANIPRHNPASLIAIILTPLIYASLACCSSHLSGVGVFILAYALGALCNFSIFKYAHEISHRLISAKLSDREHKFLLKYLTALSLSPSVYLLFRFGHKPHHANLGASSVSQAKKFLTTRFPDIELLIDRYYYELQHVPGSEYISLAPALFKHPLLRFMSVGLLFPITSTISGTLLFHIIFIIKFIKSLFTKPCALYRTRLSMAITSTALLYAVLTIIFLFFGIKAILFFLLSDLFQRGFLWHPIMCFPLATHKSWNNHQKSQPTTSIYGPLITLVMMKMNYHVEHHDFPDIPCRYLPRLKKIAPDYYNQLNSFHSYQHVLKTYLNEKHWIYATP